MRRTTVVRLLACIGCLVLTLALGAAPLQSTISCPATQCSTVIPGCNACGLFLPLHQEPCIDGGGNMHTYVLYACCSMTQQGICTR